MIPAPLLDVWGARGERSGGGVPQGVEGGYGGGVRHWLDWPYQAPTPFVTICGLRKSLQPLFALPPFRYEWGTHPPTCAPSLPSVRFLCRRMGGIGGIGG